MNFKIQNADLRNFARALMSWHDRTRRDLPWRRERSPYRVWISEIMLQQTVLSAVVSHFNRWMERFPDLASLASAEEPEVLRLWEGLGYYSRARNLHRAAKIAVRDFGGGIPDDEQALRSLPGIGPYTAAAVLSIAFGRPLLVWDANVRRLAQRLFALKTISSAEEKSARERLFSVLDPLRPGDFNEALMELGQLVCLPRSPLCAECPIKDSCRACASGLQNEIPVKKISQAERKETTVLLVLKGRSLFLSRKEDGIFEGLWMPPTLDRGTVDQARTYVRRTFGGKCAFVTELRSRVHHYTRYRDSLLPLVCRVTAGKLPDGGRWVSLDSLGDYPVPSVYRKILDDLLSHLG